VNIDDLKNMDEEVYSPEVRKNKNRAKDNDRLESPIRGLNTDFEIPDEDESEINDTGEQFRKF
jgi:hypothetical protein